MKNKKVSLVIFFLCLIPALYGLEMTHCSIQPEIGFLNGKIIENVWNVKNSTSGKNLVYTPTTKLSRLDWQMENAPYFGIDFELGFDNNLFFGLGFINGISGAYGIMEDFDWKSPDPDHLTNYSKHTNYIENMTIANFDIGYIFSIPTNFPFYIIPKFGFKFFDISYSGHGGYRQYEKENWVKKYWKNDAIVIEYTQNYLVPHLCVSTGLDITRFVSTELNLFISYSKLYNAYDIHSVRNEFFNDKIEKAWIFDADLNIFYNINSKSKIGLKGSIEYIPDSYGFTYYSSTTLNDFSEQPLSANIGGTSRLIWTYSFIFKFLF